MNEHMFPGQAAKLTPPAPAPAAYAPAPVAYVPAPAAYAPAPMAYAPAPMAYAPPAEDIEIADDV